MSAITRPWNETTLGFLAREGPVSTASIACRFAVSTTTIRRDMNDYLRRGLVSKERGSTHIGTSNYWRITDAGRLRLRAQEMFAAMRLRKEGERLVAESDALSQNVNATFPAPKRLVPRT